MRFCFECPVTLARETVFAFFENPEGLKLLHEGFSKIRLLHYERQVRVGAETWIELSVAGFVPVVMGFRHMLFEPPFAFGEQIIHGPFSRFVHIHEFDVQDRRTVVRDMIEVCLPWRYGGEIMTKRVVAPLIRRVFHNRAEAMAQLECNGSISPRELCSDVQNER
jgi:ligand-binding SRPBCC domain-containing protein